MTDHETPAGLSEAEREVLRIKGTSSGMDAVILYVERILTAHLAAQAAAHAEEVAGLRAERDAEDAAAVHYAARAESAEAERDDLRAKVTERDQQLVDAAREIGSLRAKVAALADEAKGRKAAYPAHPHWSAWDHYESDLRAVLATPPTVQREANVQWCQSDGCPREGGIKSEQWGAYLCAQHAVSGPESTVQREAEEGARVLREAADAIDSGDVDHEGLRLAGVNEIATRGWSDKSVADAYDSGSVWRDWLRARADALTETAGSDS